MTEQPKQDSKPAVTDASLLSENEMLKAQLQVREDQLREAIKIANKANDQAKARENAERQILVDRILIDSNNKFTADELKDKSITELNLIKTVISRSMDSTFASVAAFQAEQDRKTKPHLTAGAWNPATKTWTGGL